jgi:hypothetical protein
MTNDAAPTARFELSVAGKVIPLADDWIIRASPPSPDGYTLGPAELARLARLRPATLADLIDAAPTAPDVRDNLENKSREFYDRLGPWATGRAVGAALGVTRSTLASQRKSQRLLGVAFGRTQQFFYPVQQFDDGRIVDGLQPVLHALSAGFTSPEAQVAWLAEPAYEQHPETRWDILRSGQLETVVQWATADAYAACAG